MLENEQYLKILEDDTDRFNPMDWIEPLLRHRWVFILIVLSSLLVGIVYNFKATRIYQVKSSVIIKQNISSSVIREREAELSSRRRWLSQSDINTKINLINSQPFIEEVVKRLIDLGHFKSSLEAKNYKGMEPQEKERVLRGLASSIRGRISVKNPEETNIAEITCQSSDPVLAKDVVNLLADVAVEFNRNEQLLILQDSLNYLNKELDTARKKVEEAEVKLYQYRRDHNIFETDIDKTLMAERRSDLMLKLTELQEKRREFESKITQLNNLLLRKDYTKYTAVLSENEILIDLHQQLVAAEINYKRLLTNYKVKHPDIIKSIRNVEILKGTFEQELRKTLTKLEYDLNVIKSREKLLQDTIYTTNESAVASTEKDIEYVVLGREAKSARDLYQILLAAVKEVNINANSRVNDIVYVNEKAITPTRPIKPQEPNNLLLSLLVGLMLGGAYAFGREYLNQTIRNPDDVKKLVNLPVLSTIALYSGKNRKEGIVSPLLVAEHPKSLFSEGVTALRSYLDIKLPQESPVAILVTSSAPREGKSLIASNLAISMAQKRKKTLLVDTDFHKPEIHKVFGIEKQRGLYDLIVDSLNPLWSDMDLDSFSFGDLQHLIQLKQWTGTVNIQWNSLKLPLNISYSEGRAVGSNLGEWKENFSQMEHFPPPPDLSFSLDESEIACLDSTERSGKQALEFLRQFPRVCRSSYFSKIVIPNLIKKTDYDNLHILTVGSNPRNPSELLGSQQMNMLLQLLKESYDRIIIDCPPAWPLSDVSVLAPMVDGVLWICRSGEISKNMFKHHVQRIQQVQANILGIVVNAVDYHRDRYYYGYYGYSSYYRYSNYYYGDDDDKDKEGDHDRLSLPEPK